MLLVGFVACPALFDKPPCYFPRLANVTRYEVRPNTVTPAGLRVDMSMYRWSAETLAQIDTWTEELEACLSMSIARECLTVKIAPDWYLSPCTGEQLFPCQMPVHVCEQKLHAGAISLLETSPCSLDELAECVECPCHCRLTVQSQTVLVTVPDIDGKLFKAELARIVLGVNNPWRDARVRPCLRR